MSSWTGTWDDESFIGFLERTKADIDQRIKARSSLEAIAAAQAEATEFSAFVKLVRSIRGPHPSLRNADLLVDPMIEVKVAAHGRFRAYYLFLDREQAFYGALVAHGEGDLLNRLNEISARVLGRGPAAEGPPEPEAGR